MIAPCPTSSSSSSCSCLRPWQAVFSRLLGLLLIALLAACGALPRPFEGNPGSNAARLARPPPARLAVPPPDAAFLGPAEAAVLAGAIAGGLLEAEIPAVAGPPHRGDWRLAITVELRDGAAVPSYRVLDPAGEQQGLTEGLPVPAAEWTQAGTPMLRRAAAVAVPRVAALLSRIEAARRQSDPSSLINRAPRLAFSGVTGAPGDGNAALAQNMRVALVKAGQELYSSPTGADFLLAGDVVVAPAGAGKQRVEIQWIIKDAAGSEVGRVVQLNEIQRGLLDLHWGDVALVVAEEAAGGVRDVIANRIGARR